MVKNIDSDLIRGNIDTIILKTMLDGDKYGLDIIKEVEARSNGTYELKQPTLYSCLKRLENQELISSYWLDSDIGGKRHYYKLTDKGREFFAQKQEEWSKSKFIIDNLLSNFDSDEYRLVKKDDYDKIIEGKTFDYEEHKAKEAFENTATEESDDDNDETVSQNSGTETSNEAEEDDDEFGIDEYNSLLDDENDENEAEPEQEEDNEADEDDEKDEISSPIYFNNQSPEDDEDEDDGKYDHLDVNDVLLSEHEKNLLSKLRYHDDEEINTYIGDKSSYVNYVNLNSDEQDNQNDDSEEFENDEIENNIDEIESDEDNDLDNLVAVQQNLLDDTDQNDVDDFESKLSKFSKTAKELQNFDSSGETTEENEFDYVVPKPSEQTLEIENEQDEEPVEDENNEEIIENESNDFDDLTENQKSIDDEFNFDEDEVVQEDEFVTQNETNENSYNADDTYSTENEQVITNEAENGALNNENNQGISELNDDFFDELDELSDTSNSTFISSDDGIEYNHSEVDKDIENFTQSEAYENQEDFKFENEESDTSIAAEPVSDDEDDFSDDYSLAYKEDSDDFISNNNQMQSSDFSAFDNIISKNADAYSQTTMFTPTEDIYAYANRVSENKVEENSKVNEESLNKAKDINSLKEEFEMQGIKVKEFKKYETNAEAAKSYLLVNKINMVSSLILLFGYMFILSAVYIILNSTGYAKMQGFSFIPFLYGFIPFGVWAIYNLVKFIISPYKKIPAKYSAGVTIFISIMITIQLLLITYCVNLQLGFYSFTQANYNHLIWIIPTIISFFPIVSNLIYIALFYSQNFNV